MLLLSGQRITVRHSLQLEVSTQRGDGVWSGTAAIPVTYLPEKVRGMLRICGDALAGTLECH